MFVLTIDQQGSRVVGDRVEAFLAVLEGSTDPQPAAGTLSASARRFAPPVRDFERTVGDEVQAVFDDPTAVVDLVLRVLRHGGWSVGIGAGPVELPLPESTRAGAGPAFVLAREAVEAAKSRVRTVPLAVRGRDATAALDAEALLVLTAAVAARRSAEGWQVVDLLDDLGPEARQDDVAARLDISQQAVSKRLRAALWAEELAARPAAGRLLERAEAREHD
ncbi:hypothetical protein [Cellulomonas soli]|uniref:DNA-binding protein n=1 Tax=Cellulomonas soli TaxID=931535 RepID=A0A512PAD5_9CELL|nr:hypothetical protein [Cellulomonas soli]NYI60611.1 hypothetical protein [Cellulomonas soli]GEP68126.1 hypothetical protein CSO01_08410 [Cellulomonas soli]